VAGNEADALAAHQGRHAPYGLDQVGGLLRKAFELGAPLSTKETTLLLGVRPGSDPLGRGGIEARRLGRNLWQPRKAEAVAKRKSLW
jgi:hypothetical protein